MAITIKHSKVSLVADGGDSSLVRPSDWNADHDFTGTLPVANGGTGVTSSTGTGSVVLSTSPTLTTPNLGTPSAATLTNATNLPIVAGTTGTLTVARGGSGATSLTGVLKGNGTSAFTAGNVNLASEVTGTLPVSNGGTGAASLTANNVILGNGTSTVQFVAPSTTGNVLKSNGTTWVSAAEAAQVYPSAGIAVSTGTAWGTSITLGTGVSTFLTTPSSANLAAAITDETGTGALVFANSPTLVTPVLGTPSSGNFSFCTVDGTNPVGFRNIPQQAQNANYTLVLEDAGKHIYKSNTSAYTWTIPSNSSVSYPVGTAITFVNGGASGNITIAITSDTMRLAGPGTTGSRTLAGYGIATAVKVASTTWIISGTGLT